MKMRDNPPGNDFQIHCPKLGHRLSFSYCFQENWGKPCPKTLDCWHLYFHVVPYMQTVLAPEDWEEVFVQKAPVKVVSLLDLIEKTRKLKEKE